MNGSPAGGPPPSSSQPPTTAAEPRPPWLTPDLVSALRPPFYHSSFPSPATTASTSHFLHPQHSPGGPLSSLHPPYHQLYGPLSAAANYHAAAAAISGHRPFLDPAAFLGPRYRYLLPTNNARFPLSGSASAVASGGGTGSASTVAERSLSESEGLGPGRPSPWRRPLSPAAHNPHKPPAPLPDRQLFRPPEPTDPSRFRVPSTGDGGGGGSGGGTVSSGGIGTGGSGGPSLPTQPYYPSHFMRGTVIQLASGELKRVEELNTEDFVRSANMSSQLKMDSSTVVRVEEKTKDIVLLCFSVGENKVQVSVEATVEHPFFVIGQGWSSCNPDRTRILYGLPCQRLQVGDICISLTHRDVGSASLSASLRRLKSPRAADVQGHTPTSAPPTSNPPAHPPSPPAHHQPPKRPASQPRPNALLSAPKRPRSWTSAT